MTRYEALHKDTLTDWLPAGTEPAREGVYERRAPAGRYSCWSTDRWYGDEATPEAAASSKAPSAWQLAAWRGMSTPPSEPCWACRGHTVIDHGVDEETQADRIEECIDC